MDKPNNGRDWMHILNALTAHPLVVEPTPLKNDGVKVSWGDDIPNIWKTYSKPVFIPISGTHFRHQLVADLRRSVSGWLSDSNGLGWAAQQEMGTGENIWRSPDPHHMVTLALPVQWIPST